MMELTGLDFLCNQGLLKCTVAIAACAVGAVTLVSKYESLTKESKSSKPYSSFGHPKKFLLDKLVGLVFPLLVPFHMLTSISHRADEKNKSILDFVRKRLHMVELYVLHWPSCKLWNRMLRKNNDKDFLVGGTVMIPRNSNILSDWGVQKQSSSVPNMMDSEWPVELEITCPMSVIRGNVTIEEKGFGYEKFKTCKLEDLDLAPSVPIILYFHGGGFATGGARDVFPFLVQSLLGHQCKVNRDEGKKDLAVPPLIVASVKYRLCPENPFPAGAIDCLSAAKVIIEKFPKADIHVCGFSAGGNLSTMVGFECVRKFPGRLKSIVSLHPFLLPRANTVSIHMNSMSSYITPATLRWFWASYLQFNAFDEKDNSEEIKCHKLFQLGGIGAVNPMLRICYPQVDIPFVELRSESAPKIFVTTGSADPLRDDGDDLVESLEQYSIDVHAYESCGSHGLAMLCDLGWKKRFVQEWSQCIWS